MAGNRSTVTVSRQGMTALEEPRFLLEVDGKLYLTLAVLEYDPSHPKITKDQATTIRSLKGQMSKGAKASAVHFPSDGLTSEVIAANMVSPGPGPSPQRPKS